MFPLNLMEADLHLPKKVLLVVLLCFCVDGIRVAELVFDLLGSIRTLLFY